MRSLSFQLLFLLLFLNTVFTHAKADSVSVKIHQLSGKAYFEGKPISEGDVISRPGVLRVKGEKNKKYQDGAFLDLKFSDGSLFRLNEGEIKIHALTSSKKAIYLNYGGLYGYVHPQENGKQKKKKNSYFIRTKKATMGVRGTKFWLLEDAQSTYLCVCEGVVDMKKNKNTKVLKPGQDIHAYLDKDLENPQTAPDKMWKMATEAFAKMNMPLVNDPRK